MWPLRLYTFIFNRGGMMKISELISLSNELRGIQLSDLNSLYGEKLSPKDYRKIIILLSFGVGNKYEGNNPFVLGDSTTHFSLDELNTNADKFNIYDYWAKEANETFGDALLALKEDVAVEREEESIELTALPRKTVYNPIPKIFLKKNADLKRKLVTGGRRAGNR